MHASRHEGVDDFADLFFVLRLAELNDVVHDELLDFYTKPYASLQTRKVLCKFFFVLMGVGMKRVEKGGGRTVQSLHFELLRAQSLGFILSFATQRSVTQFCSY